MSAQRAAKWLERVPLRAATFFHAPSWAKSAVLYWSKDDPDHEYLIGWGSGIRTLAKHIRIAVRDHDPASPLLRRRNLEPRAKMATIHPRETVLATLALDKWAWGDRFADIRTHERGARLVSVAEAAVAWRERAWERPKPGVPELPLRVRASINTERNGVELRMNRKPEIFLQIELREARFRWSPFGQFWWRDRTPEALAFAEALEKRFPWD